MVMWFAAGAVVAVWSVFRSPAMDFRMVAAGAVAVDAVDVAWGGAGPAHSLLGAVAVLTIVMAATRGRRLVRRRWLGVPIGVMMHLALDAAWARAEVFWWPLRGGSPGDHPLPVVERGWTTGIVLELIGVGLALWFWRRFRLDDPERRRRFARTGQVDRDLAGPPPGLGGPPVS